MSTAETTQIDAILRPFAELTRADVPYAGGKGANLGELTWAGVPVSPGFVFGAPTYAAFCDESGLRERIAARLERLDVQVDLRLQGAVALDGDRQDRRRQKCDAGHDAVNARDLSPPRLAAFVPAPRPPRRRLAARAA